MFCEHHTFLDAFGGSGVVLLKKEPAKVDVWNDLSKEVYNFFYCLRNHPEETMKAIEFTPFHREEFNQSLSQSEDPVEQARRTFVKQTMGFSGKQRQTKGNFGGAIKKSSNHMSAKVSQYLSNIRNLYDVIERLKTVQIECLPALECIKKYDHEELLVYVDPPYLPETRKTQGTYEEEMTYEDHEELGELLNNIQGKAVVSGYDSQLYNDMFKAWNKTEIKNVPVSAHKREKVNHEKRTEVVWTNYEQLLCGH